MELHSPLAVFCIFLATKPYFAYFAHKSNCLELGGGRDKQRVNFTVTISEECTRNIVFVNVLRANDRYCHFIHIQSKCVDTTKLGVCVCDSSSRQYSVWMDVSGAPDDQSGGQWMLKGVADGQRTIFHEPLEIPPWHPPQVESLQVMTTNGALSKAIVHIDEHSRLKLHCSWKPGNPQTDARLVKDGVLLNSVYMPGPSGEIRQREVSIDNVGCLDGGNVSCEASGAEKNQSVYLHVVCKTQEVTRALETTTSRPTGSHSSLTNVLENDTLDITTMQDSTAKTEEDNAGGLWGQNFVLYISVGGMFLIIIIFTTFFGVFIHRKVSSLSVLGATMTRTDAEHIQMRQMHVAKDAQGNRDSALSIDSNTYAEAKDDKSTSNLDTLSRSQQLHHHLAAALGLRRIRHCSPPPDDVPPPLPPHPLRTAASESDYLHPTATKKDAGAERGRQVECTCFRNDEEGAVGGACPHQQKSQVGEPEECHAENEDAAVNESELLASSVQGLASTEDHGSLSLHKWSLRNIGGPISIDCHTKLPLSIKSARKKRLKAKAVGEGRTSIMPLTSRQGVGGLPLRECPERIAATLPTLPLHFSTDSDGYMLPRPELLSRPTKPSAAGDPARSMPTGYDQAVQYHAPSDYVSHSFLDNPRTFNTSADMTQNSQTCSWRPTPLKRKKTAALSSSPHPRSKAMGTEENENGGYMCMNKSSEEYMTMTRPTGVVEVHPETSPNNQPAVAVAMETSTGKTTSQSVDSQLVMSQDMELQVDCQTQAESSSKEVAPIFEHAYENIDKV